jgi:hypothetical protein
MALSQLLPALALAIAALTYLRSQPPVNAVAGPSLWNDLGNLLLAFVMLWTYVSFSQFLLIWSGNLPEKITWYIARGEGGWQWIAIALAAFNFALPFLLLLARDLKRDPARLRLVALLVVVMAFVNEFWLIAPAFSRSELRIHWLDIAALCGVGGLWLTVFLWQVQTLPVLPVHHALAAEEALHHA